MNYLQVLNIITVIINVVILCKFISVRKRLKTLLQENIEVVIDYGTRETKIPFDDVTIFKKQGKNYCIDCKHSKQVKNTENSNNDIFFHCSKCNSGMIIFTTDRKCKEYNGSSLFEHK